MEVLVEKKWEQGDSTQQATRELRLVADEGTNQKLLVRLNKNNVLRTLFL